MLPREDKSTKPNKTRARHYPHKAWYNPDCEMKRREYIKFKNRCRQLKNVNNLDPVDLLRQAGKVYEKEINKAFRKYKETIVHKVGIRSFSGHFEFEKLCAIYVAQKESKKAGPCI